MTDPKLILVPFSGNDEELGALDYAFGLADTHGAHIACWHITPDPQDIVGPYTAYGAFPAYPEKTITEMEKANEASLKEAEQKFSMAAAKTSMEKISFHTATGRAENILAVKGRLADAIVMARTDHNAGYGNVANGALFDSGQPVILVPSGATSPHFNGNVLIAWNGSREAARAISCSLPHLKQGKISILTVQDNDSETFPLSPEDLAQYLRRHGVELNIIAQQDRKTTAPAYILETAKSIDAGMIVMGAWGHSRIREYILGGVTDFMLHNADLPVFMAH